MPNIKYIHTENFAHVQHCIFVVCCRSILTLSLRGTSLTVMQLCDYLWSASPATLVNMSIYRPWLFMPTSTWRWCTRFNKINSITLWNHKLIPHKYANGFDHCLEVIESENIIEGFWRNLQLCSNFLSLRENEMAQSMKILPCGYK